MKFERIIKTKDGDIIVEREFDVEDFLEMSVSQYYCDRKRGKPRPPKKEPSRDRSKEYARESKRRRARRKAGLCTACGRERPTEGYRMCESCRIRYRIINARCRSKEIFPLTQHGLSIDLD